jgi:hypothetical protein
MAIRQLSLFVENRPGQLRAPAKVLAGAGIDILAMSLADTEQFGILRLIVTDWEKAKRALEAAGFVVNLTDVIAVDVPDRPGGLAEALDAVGNAGLDVEYMYSLDALHERGKHAALVFRLEDPERAAKLLAAQGVRLVSPDELLARPAA